MLRMLPSLKSQKGCEIRQISDEMANDEGRGWFGEAYESDPHH